MSPVLHTKIAAVRSKQALLATARGAAYIVAAMAILLAFTMTLDYFLELPRWVRAALLAVDLTVAMYLLLWYVAAPFVFGPDDEEIALLVERHRPEFRTRLIASIQLSRPGAVPAGSSPGLVRAMVAQTEQLASGINFADAVRADRTLITAAICSFILLLGAGAYGFTRPDIRSALILRAFLSNTDVPRDTRVHPLTEDLTLAIGDPASLQARASGVVPDSGTVRVEYESGRKQQFTLQPTADAPDVFARTIENVQESFKYRVHLNDGHGPWHTVTAVPRPAVSAAEFIQISPAYTRLPPQRKSPGDLSLLAGSKLTVKVTASKPVRQGRVRLVGLDRDVPLALDPANPASLTGTLDVPPRGLTGLSIHLTDPHSITSRAETVYPVQLLPDNPPTVRITYPDRKEGLATAAAKERIGFEAGDDFGIEKVVLKYINETAAPGVEKSIELDLEPERQKAKELAGSDLLRNLRLQHDFDLPGLKPTPVEGTVVEYWLEVRDANNITGPGVAFSEHFKVKIVSETEKRADLLNRLNDQFGSVESITQEQEKTGDRLGALVMPKAGPTTRP